MSRRSGMVLLLASERRCGVQNSRNTAGIRQKGHPELKCYVTPIQRLVRKRVCSGRHTFSTSELAKRGKNDVKPTFFSLRIIHEMTKLSTLSLLLHR